MARALVFYISGHGFGHASRDVEIINALGRDARIVIRSQVSPGLLARTISVPYELIPGPCDTGIVQVTSIQNDDRATIAAATEFYRTFTDRVDAEVAMLNRQRPALIVGDIAPLAFAVAARLGIPGVAVANFTWDWIYETHPGFLPEGAPLLATMREAYQRAALALQLPFSAGFDVFPRVEPLPLIARQPTATRAATRARLGWPADRPVALASFGGYGLPSLDLTRVDCAGDWTVATTDRVSPQLSQVPAHVHYLAEHELDDVPYQNIIAAADAVVTKPGYGILSECIATGTPMLYTSRGTFREYDVLVAAMPRVVRCQFISPSDLLAGRWSEALGALQRQPRPPETMATHGAQAAAARLEQFLEDADHQA